MAGRALIVLDEALGRRNEGIIDATLAAGTRRGVHVEHVTFVDAFENPVRALDGMDAVVLAARTEAPFTLEHFFRPTQVPAAGLATLAIGAGVRRVTAVVPSIQDSEVPVLLCVHLVRAGVTGILELADLLKHTRIDATVDPTLPLTDAYLPTERDLKVLQRQIREAKHGIHSGWDLSRFDVPKLRTLAGEHPQLAEEAAASAEPDYRVSELKRSMRSLFRAIDRGPVSEALGARVGTRGHPAQVTLWDLRAFLGFDLHPRALLGFGRAQPRDD